jgi:signal transduction histidine kinase
MKNIWNSVLNIGLTPHLSEFETKRLHLVNLISFLCCTVTSAALVVNYIFENTLLIWICIFTILGFAFAIFLNWKRQYIAATFFLVSCPFYFAFTTVYGYGNVMEIEYVMILIPIAGFMLFEKRRHQVLLFIFSISALLFLKALYLTSTPIFEPKNPLILEMIAAVSAILIGFVLMKLFQSDNNIIRNQNKLALENLQKVNQELMEKEKALLRKNKELEFQIQLKEEAQLAMGESENRFQMLFNNGFDGIILFNLNTLKTVGCNQKMLDFFETDLDELKQASIFDYLEKEQPIGSITDDVVKGYVNTIRTKGRVSYSCLYRSKKGRRLAAQVTAVLSPPPNEDIAVAIFRDVMPEWNAREKIIKANRELTNFAHAASHDLREPLRMIHSFAQLLERRNESKFDDSSMEFLNFITDASKRMTTLVNDLLDYATTGTQLSEIQPVDLNDYIFKITNNLHLTIQETQATIEAGELPIIDAHPTLITQLFQNIISNGIKFRKASLPPTIKINCIDKEHSHLITISDNGIGIREEDQKKIFNVFRRLHSKQEYEGSGIGLATCKKIVDKYGGKIWVESAFGHGSTFFILLPKMKNNPQKVANFTKAKEQLFFQN